MSRFYIAVLKRVVALSGVVVSACAQYDPGKEIDSAIANGTHGKLDLTFQIRSRVESRHGQVFGRDPDLFANFMRTRLGLTYTPVPWLKLSGLAQDARAPLLGMPAPGTMRDPVDLQEGYVELFGDRKRGFGSIVGRQMAEYGDTRLIGSPQWAYTARTYDTARVYWWSARARIEALFLSPVRPRGDGFNRPALRNRIWGMYNAFSGITRNDVLDVYALRHDEGNGAAGLRTSTFGSRWARPLPRDFRYTLEAALQTGRAGTATHRAAAWAGVLGFRRQPVDVATEYKYASGSRDPASGRSGTFDQISPAAHDKLGHADLIGWRNVHNVKSTVVWSVAKPFSVTFMYNNTWLASARDALYNIQGVAIARSLDGSAGRHVGQEVDVIGTYRLSGLTLSAGYAHFFRGEFVRKATAGVAPRFVYLSTTYGF